VRGVRGLDIASYGRALFLLFRHPQIMLGPLLAAVATVLLSVILPSGEGFVGSANSGLSGLIDQLITSFGLAIAIVVSDSVWRYGRASFDDAWETARRRGGDILFAALGVSFVVYVAQLLGGIVPVYGPLAMFALATYFMIYALPAAAIGGIPGGASLQISVERARAYVVPTLLVTALYLFAFVAIGLFLIPLLTPVLLAFPGLASGHAFALVLAVFQALFGGYVGLMLAKTYENVSYGRFR
jgi:hypothetical protein